MQLWRDAEKSHYRVSEIADLLDVSVSTIYREIHAGHLRALRVGRRGIRVPASDLDAYRRCLEVAPAA
jgi:excisionase family DNA binding protein